ncbi:MAG TPA: hypothetical protein VJ810_34945 [Blastocatellia bacterium]|nr:hypothetical protein [Blastocatellia bacterium]
MNVILVGEASTGIQTFEWMWIDRALIEGRRLPAADILQSGARLDNGI